MQKNIIVTIDGPSGSGKSTTAKFVAQQLGFTYLDTGAMFRAVALFTLRNDLQKNLENLVEHLSEIDIHMEYSDGKTTVYLNGEDVSTEIRTLEVSNLVSPVSAIPEVRTFLLKQQRKIGEVQSIVLDGRDTGTVVFPNADVKFFLIASIEMRAIRRFNELKQLGKEANLDDIKHNLEERDRIDSTRNVAPLKKAEDAIEVDTSNISIDEQVSLVIEEIHRKLGKG